MRRGRARFAALLTALLAAAALAAGLVACAPEEDAAPTARPVTSEEAQLLAIARFHSFDAGSRGFETVVRERGSDVRLSGWVDYAAGVGYAAATSGGDGMTSGGPHALLWTGNDIGIISAEPDATGHPVLPIPPLSDAAWRSRPIDISASRLDAVISVIAALGADRPDNPLLVQQSGALWLGTDEIDGETVTVFAAPPADEPLTASSPPVTAETSPLRLWVDAGGLIHRADARVGADWVTITFSVDSGPSLHLAEVAP